MLDFSLPHVLRNAKEYRAAVTEIDVLLDRDPRRGTAEYDRLEFLSVLVEAYEDEHVPVLPATTPQEAVEFMLEQKGMTRPELAPLFGGKSRVSEFFAGKRALSIGQVKAVRDALGLPADLLIG
ncbi:MAG: transcriptional regulator [Gemmatimonadota bacterium]|nr:transcriptional regulator [Gemmatimonadota bacterium]